MARGPAFNPEDDAALTRSWMEVSSRHDEQNSTVFWGAVLQCFEKQENRSGCYRSQESLRSQWN